MNVSPLSRAIRHIDFKTNTKDFQCHGNQNNCHPHEIISSLFSVQAFLCDFINVLGPFKSFCNNEIFVKLNCTYVLSARNTVRKITKVIRLINARTCSKLVLIFATLRCNQLLSIVVSNLNDYPFMNRPPLPRNHETKCHKDQFYQTKRTCCCTLRFI